MQANNQFITPESQQQNDFFEEDTIDLRHYWRVLVRFRWGIAGLGALSAVITALVLISTENIYESSATLLIESNQANITSIEDIYGIEAQSREYFSTQFELLKNRVLAERVISELDLSSHAEFSPVQDSFSIKTFIKGLLPSNSSKENSPPLVTEEQIQAAQVLSAFNKRLTITPVRNTDLVSVTFESTSPQLAADAANSLANAYIENYLEQRLASTQQASVWMTDRLSGLKDALDSSEQTLQSFLEDERLVDIQGIASLNIQELDEFTTQNTQARRTRAEAETIYRQTQELQNSSSEQVLLIPAVLNHPALSRVRENMDGIEQQFAELSQRYGRKHPRMIALSAERIEVQKNLDRQLQQVLASIENNYQAAVNNEQVTQERLEQAKNDFQDVTRKNFELRELEREVESDRQLYDLFFTRLRETNETTDFQSSPAIIVDPAIAAISPSKPRRSLITVIALIAGLMLGTMLAFLRDMLDNTIHSPADIEEKLGTTTLGLIPFVDENKEIAKDGTLAYLGFIEDSHSSFSESFRTIRTGMMLSSLDKPFKLIAVTSSVPNEGKTTISINLASVMGQMKKTLLIDADMRRPALAKSLDIDPKSPGLSNYIAGTSELKDCVFNFKKGGFGFMPGGQIVPNPLELLSSPKFKELLVTLSKTFDQIIIDTPPTQAVSDALVIGSMVDAMVYVVKAEATPINVIKTGLSRLRYANANVIGVTLNQVDTSKQSSYYYYGGYYDSYGYSSHNEEQPA